MLTKSTESVKPILTEFKPHSVHTETISPIAGSPEMGKDLAYGLKMLLLVPVSLPADETKIEYEFIMQELTDQTLSLPVCRLIVPAFIANPFLSSWQVSPIKSVLADCRESDQNVMLRMDGRLHQCRISSVRSTW